MNFYDEILYKTGLPPEEAVGTKVLFVDMRAVYIEGHRGLCKMSDEEMVFRYKKRFLSVKGVGLRLNELSSEEAYVVGKIRGVEVCDE